MNPDPGLLLINPKFASNVGSALRTCALLGISTLGWTGHRVPDPALWPEGTRLPREERMRCYQRTELRYIDDEFRPIDAINHGGMTPVCVEIVPGAVPLDVFEHPQNALYVFGPEDGDIPKGIRHACHHFVSIPNAIDPEDVDGRTPYNLSVAISLVLFHRLLQKRELERDALFEYKGHKVAR